MNTANLDHGSQGHDDGAGKPRRDPDSALAELIPVRTSEGCAVNGSPSNGGGKRRLTPRRPPGRWHGKARAFASEIGRLHAEGFTFEAIREALADAGVAVSNSTVQREVARLRLLSKPGLPADTDSLPR